MATVMLDTGDVVWFRLSETDTSNVFEQESSEDKDMFFEGVEVAYI